MLLSLLLQEKGSGQEHLLTRTEQRRLFLINHKKILSTTTTVTGTLIAIDAPVVASSVADDCRLLVLTAVVNPDID